MARVSYDAPSLRARRQDRLDVTVGIVGPAALTKEIQIFWHDKVTPAPRPNGWDNQLKNEPILQLRYESALRWPRREGGKADITSRFRGNFGNALIGVEADVTGRVGWNLSHLGGGTYSSPPREAGGRKPARNGPRVLASGSLFLRGGMHAVAHNIVLDGNSFARNDIRIDKKPFVPEVAAGFEVNLIGNFWVTAQRVHRAGEFRTWRGRDAPDQKFTAVTVAWIRRLAVGGRRPKG
jgi:hypothetical protein